MPLIIVHMNMSFLIYIVVNKLSLYESTIIFILRFTDFDNKLILIDVFIQFSVVYQWRVYRINLFGMESYRVLSD